MARRSGVSCTVFAFVVTLLLGICIAVGLLVYFLACPEKHADTQNATTPAPPTPAPTPYLRLPTSLKPSKYQLSVKPYFPAGSDIQFPSDRNFTFDGNVTITIECLEKTGGITLHMHKINLLNDSIQLSDVTDGRVVPIDLSGYKYDPQTQLATFFPQSAYLLPGRTYRLHLDYFGKLVAADLAGFYPSSYLENGETKWLVATQFEPTDARRALPCFDEPSFKAAFEITIIHPSNMKAISNGMENETRSLGEEGTPLRYDASCLVASHLASVRGTVAVTDGNRLSGLSEFIIWVYRYKNSPNYGRTLVINGLVDFLLTYGCDAFSRNGWSVTNFEPTPTMSTYLLAFSVCAFESKQSYTEDKRTLFRVWARPSLIHEADYAVSAGPTVLDYYAKYFNISFPLKKQDMLAIPDFAAGAMENWGLVTYRESALLFDPKVYASNNRQRVAVVVAHELSHQWFGDLVTMAWWDDLWLNEGFANYMQYVGSDVIADGEFRMDQQFISNLDAAMRADQLSTSHPIFVNVSSPDEINAIFDDISYNKGASVLRMLNYTVSEDLFQQGLHLYLNTHQYGNANHHDLWAALTRTVNGAVLDWDSKPLDVAEYMNPWILQTGYPLLNVQRSYGQPTGDVVITQERYLLLKNYAPKVRSRYEESPFNYTWYVPVWYQFQSADKVQFAWLQPLEELHFQSPDQSKWLLVNYEVAGYFRVNYDERNWKLLQDQLRNNFQVINIKNRAQLLDDAFNLARAGYLDYQIALDNTLYLFNETSFVPWDAAMYGFGYIEDMLILSSAYPYYKDFMLALMLPMYNQTGWDDSQEGIDDVLDHYRRTLSKTVLCNFGYADCLERAGRLFRSFSDSCKESGALSSTCSPVAPNLRRPVYCAGGSSADETGWNLLWDLHSREQVAVEKDSLMHGLCCTKSPSLLTKLLDEAVNPNSTIVRRQDIRSVFQYIGSNEVGRILLWEYFQDNWDKIGAFSQMGLGSGLGAAITAATRSFNTEFQAKMLETFYRNNADQLGSASTTLQQQIEIVNANVVWMQNYRHKVVQWLQVHV